MALTLTLDAGGEVVGARVAVGCVGPRRQRFPGVERLASDCTVTDLLADRERLAAAVAETVEPADDPHGSAEYKRDMTRVFVRRGFEVVAARATG